ncbi:MAG: hypothetical protein QN702_09315 [Nitrososphaeraceae archaeon]|nr:hypothetical protein [Nitrososphaeraceae archaeon]
MTVVNYLFAGIPIFNALRFIININATKLSEIKPQLELKRATDDNIKYNPAKNEKGNPIKGTAIWHKINNIIRIKTLKGNFHYQMENS